MTELNNSFSFDTEEFSGKVRLFPLPNFVLFPHVMQPLHIFEPRYRDLLEEALQQDRLVAMATLMPGWEDDYEGRPPIFPVACLGGITAHHRLAEGSYNVLVSGLRRVRLVRELPPAKSFREADAEICEDLYPNDISYQPRLKQELREAFLSLLSGVVGSPTTDWTLVGGGRSTGRVDGYPKLHA